MRLWRLRSATMWCSHTTDLKNPGYSSTQIKARGRETRELMVSPAGLRSRGYNCCCCISFPDQELWCPKAQKYSEPCSRRQFSVLCCLLCRHSLLARLQTLASLQTSSIHSKNYVLLAVSVHLSMTEYHRLTIINTSLFSSQFWNLRRSRTGGHI